MNLLLQPLGSCPRHAENGKHRKRLLFKNQPFSLARQQKTLEFIVFLSSRQRKIQVFKKWSIPVFFYFSDCCGIDSQLWKECVIGNTRRIILWSSPPPVSGHDGPACCERTGGFPECRGRCCRRPTLGFHRDPPRGVPSRAARNGAEQIFVRCYFVILFTIFEQITK